MEAHTLETRSSEDIERERAVARKLRASRWWKRKSSKGRCHYCNRIVPPRELTMDHLIPVVRGGSSEKWNLVPACKDCNNKKKNLLTAEWEEYLETFNR